MATEKVRYEKLDDLAVITMDDGKANALSEEVLDGLTGCFDRAAAEAAAVVLAGREGRLSGGFDLRQMTSSPAAAQSLVLAGAELMLRIYTFPRPVVVACTGHALAAGALLLLVGDFRVGARGEFKIGLNEVAIQMTLPRFAVELARDRLSKRHFTLAVTQARIYDPETARDAGYLDATEEPPRLLEAAIGYARRLAALPAPAFANTKGREREATIRLIRETLASDIAELTTPR